MSRKLDQTGSDDEFLFTSQTIGREFSEKYKEEFKMFPKSIRVYLNTLAGAGILKKRIIKDADKTSSSSGFEDADQSSFSSNLKSGSSSKITDLLDTRKELIGDLNALLNHAESDNLNPVELVLDAKRSIISLIGLIQDRRKSLENAVVADVNPIVTVVASNVHDAVTAEHPIVVEYPTVVEESVIVVEHPPVVEENEHDRDTAPYLIVPKKTVTVVELTEPVFFRDLKGTRVADQKLIETAPHSVVPGFVNNDAESVPSANNDEPEFTLVDSSDFTIIPEEVLEDFIVRVDSGFVIPTDDEGVQEESPEDTEPPKDFD
jgi:hypothetical protein